MLQRFNVKTKGHNDVVDITDKVAGCVEKNDIKDGAVLVFVSGSTATVSTIEYEPGLVSDIKEVLEDSAPTSKDWEHNKRWGDGNGAAHLRATLTKPSLIVPVEDGQLVLGTWQQIVLIDFDNRPREREVIIKFLKS